MPRRLLKPNRLGYRGASLLAYGLIFFITGLPLLLGIFNIKPIAHPASIGIPIWAGGFVAAGNLAMSFAQNTLDAAAATIVRANSWLKLTRIR